MITMCGTQLKDRRMNKDLMLIVGLPETTDQLAWQWQCLLLMVNVEEGRLPCLREGH